MNITFVHVHIKPEAVDRFREISTLNAKNSIHEPGAVRFDFFQQTDDPTQFVLVEIYRTPEDAGKHKDTPHYKAWRDAVAEMQVEPRKGVKYQNIFPSDSEWK